MALPKEVPADKVQRVNEALSKMSSQRLKSTRAWRALTNYSVGKIEENCNATGDVMAALG
jgi:muconolactone delta-isomerase